MPNSVLNFEAQRSLKYSVKYVGILSSRPTSH